MPSAILSILSITFCGYLEKKKTLKKMLFSVFFFFFFLKLLLRQCKNRPQELHFLVVIKQVRRPPELSVSWNPRNKRSRAWGAGSLLPKPSVRRPPRERGPPTTRADAPHPTRGPVVGQVGFGRRRPSHPQRAASPADSRASPLPAPRGGCGPQSGGGHQTRGAGQGRRLTHRHPRKTWFAQAMEKETSCCSCRLRLPLSASAASSALAAAAPPVGARSPALRSRNSRRWRQCLSVSPSQRSASTQAATRGFWLRYSDTSCAMLGLRVAEAASRRCSGREAGCAGASGPVTAACTGGPPENAPREAQTPNNSAGSRRTAHFRPPPAPSLL